MNFKIIELTKDPDVLLYRDIESSTGAHLVRILAIEEEEGQEFFHEDVVEFTNGIAASNFVEDYTPDSAQSWIRSQLIKE